MAVYLDISEVFMKETGVVTETKGDMAVVKVERLVPNGCGCGVTNGRRTSWLKSGTSATPK
jgi:hypothetical protein